MYAVCVWKPRVGTVGSWVLNAGYFIYRDSTLATRITLRFRRGFCRGFRQGFLSEMPGGETDEASGERERERERLTPIFWFFRGGQMLRLFD